MASCEFDFTTQDLAVDVISTAGKVLLAQLYGIQLQQQQQIGKGNDVALAMRAAAYQEQMISSASYFQNSNVSDFIKLLSGLENCATLVLAFSSLIPFSYADFEESNAKKYLGTITDYISNIKALFSLIYKRFSLANNSIGISK